MFRYLQRKWNISGWRFVLVFLTFALGGSACGWLGKRIMQVVSINHRAAWLTLYILLVTCLWPFCILAVSLLFGQFSFFKQYIQRIFARFKKNHPSNNHPS